jgi:hypothetical protein
MNMPQSSIDGVTFADAPPENGMTFPSREYCRAPKDDAPCDSRGECGPCFACLYEHSGGGSASGANNMLDANAARDGHGDIMRLIRSNYGSVSLKELVNMVFEHYNKHVQPWVQHGEWTKRCIAQHIVEHMADDDIQINEGITALFSQIESLRDVCWYTEEGTDRPLPDVKHIKLLHDLTKSTAALIESRKKRR